MSMAPETHAESPIIFACPHRCLNPTNSTLHTQFSWTSYQWFFLLMVFGEREDANLGLVWMRDVSSLILVASSRFSFITLFYPFVTYPGQPKSLVKGRWMNIMLWFWKSDGLGVVVGSLWNMVFVLFEKGEGEWWGLCMLCWVSTNNIEPFWEKKRKENPYAHSVSNQICDIAMAIWHQPIERKVPLFTARSCILWHQTKVNMIMTTENLDHSEVKVWPLCKTIWDFIVNTIEGSYVTI